MKTNPLGALLALCISVPLLTACISNPAIEESRMLMTQGRMEDPIALLEQASREAPGNGELRAQYFRQRDAAAQQLVAQAQAEVGSGQLEAAESTYGRVQKFDPNNLRVRDGLAVIAVQRRLALTLTQAQALFDQGDRVGAEKLLRTILSQAPAHSGARRLLLALREKAGPAELTQPALKAGFAQPVTLEFRDTPLRTVFEVLSRTSGINFVFDKDVKADAKVTIFVRNAGLDEVMKLILMTNQLERKVLNENSVLIYPNLPGKAKEYQELVTRSFFLANADVKQAQVLVRSLVKTKDIFVDEKLNLLIIKDTAQAVELAAHLLESLDMAEPEVMLDVEVLEVTRSKLLELGLRFPDQIGYGQLNPTSNATVVNGSVSQTNVVPGGALAQGFIDINNAVGLTTYVSNPALTLNLRNAVGDGNTLANPRIRVKNREKAKIHIGDKLPVFTTTSTANVGVAASVSYLDVGLKLEVEPNVYLDDEVAIKVGLEVSSVVKEISGPSNSLAYQIGTRSASTVLQLRNGETQVLAGLISNEERSSANRLPGLGSVPVLGRLFSSQKDSSTQTEIVLLITPRVVRNVARGESLGQAYPAGSEASVGAQPTVLRSSPVRSLSMSSSATGKSAPTPAVDTTPVVEAEVQPLPTEEPSKP